MQNVYCSLFTTVRGYGLNYLTLVGVFLPDVVILEGGDVKVPLV